MNIPPRQSRLRKGRVSATGQVYLVTTVTLNRARFFEDFRTACAAASCFDEPQILRSTVMLAWVLMPDHAHWLLQLGDADNLGAVVGRLKSGSARAANLAQQRTKPLWQRAYHDRALRKDEDVLTAARYLVANPMRAGLVRTLGDYPFWNAVWLQPPKPAPSAAPR